MKKIISIFTAIALSVAVLPTIAFANNDEVNTGNDISSVVQY